MRPSLRSSESGADRRPILIWCVTSVNKTPSSHKPLQKTDNTNTKLKLMRPELTFKNDDNPVIKAESASSSTLKGDKNLGGQQTGNNENAHQDKGLIKIFVMTLIFILLFHPGINANTVFTPCTITTEICNNGIDDDGDGLVDGADPECAADCSDGERIDLVWSGLKNDIPKSLSISNTSNIDSIVVEVFYLGGSPGSTIIIEDDLGNTYTAYRETLASNRFIYRATLPATSQIDYNNLTNDHRAQSIIAFVYRSNVPGKSATATHTYISGYNNTKTLEFKLPVRTGAEDVVIQLPVSEITYDNRILNFAVTAGSVNAYVAKSWAPEDEAVNGCCMDIIEIVLPDVPPSADKVTIDIISPGGGTGQSYVIAGTVLTDFSCLDEICGNGTDDDGDGLADCDDPECGGIPVAVASGDLTICAGASVSISASAKGGVTPYAYSWSHGLGDGSLKVVSPSITTTYTVTVTGGNECTETDEVTIVVNPSPTADAGEDQSVCASIPFTLSGAATGGTTPYSYSWNQGLGTGTSHDVTPSDPTVYTLTVASPNGCVDTDQITLTPESCAEDCTNGIDDDNDGLTDCNDPDCTPVLDAGSDVNICQGESIIIGVTVNGTSGSYSYSWNNGHSGQSQIVSPSATTTFAITVTSAGGCTATDEVTVNVVVCGEDCTNGIDDDGDGLIDCDDPDCITSAAPNLTDDAFTACPGLPVSDRVTFNDENLQSPAFSIASNPTNGMVSIDATGKFTYTPFVTNCMNDQFIYEVCNMVTGCCSQATVYITFGDVTAPILTNVPADLTIGCDDAVPTPPQIVAYDECPGIFVDYVETSDEHNIGACETYTITRTWLATDLCGNTATGTQIITVVDQTKPEIFRLYTLDNGMRMIAGVAKRVTKDWKYIPFPVTFNETPMIFSTVVTDNELSAVTTRQRNPYSQGFELRLYEEEGNDGTHQPEDVAWIAIEAGTNTGSMALEAGRWENINDAPGTVAFSDMFDNIPGLLASIQSTNDEDPVGVRLNTSGNGSAEIFLQEEQSADSETSHVFEHVGYLAFNAGSELIDERQEPFGETGRIDLTNAWTTIALNRTYTKPVVMVGGISNNDGNPVLTRVRNVTNNSFEVRLEEWGYLDGTHSAESISWLVMEGAIPGDMDYYCYGSASGLETGINVFAMDNCDDQVAFGYTETPSVQAGGTLTIRTWMAIDDCGNTTLTTRYDTCTNAALYARAKLSGAMINNGGGENMRDDLRTKELVPVREPYSSLPGFPHVEGTSGSNEDSGNDNNDPDPNDMVIICHNPGTPAEKTMEIPESALNAYLSSGDYLGPCGGSGEPDPNGLPNGAITAQFRTIADGDWNDDDIWQGGSAPPLTNVNNKTISIEHFVYLQSGGIQLKNNSTLWITNGGLTIQSGNFQNEKSDLVLYNSDLVLNAGDLQFTKGQATMYAENSSLSVDGNFQSLGTKNLEGVCLTVTGSYENEGTVEMHHVCGVIGSSFNNKSGAELDVFDVKMNVQGGIFENASSATLTGDSLIVWVENGDLKNNGSWSALVLQYCVSGSSIGFAGVLPISEDCAGIADFFNPCECIQPGEFFSSADPDGNGEPGDDPINNPDTLSMAEIAGPGTLDPVLLEVDGDDAIVDWMLIELRNAEDETEIIAYSTVAMQRDGDIITEDGEGLINFPELPEGEYYVAIRHRNHLPLMTDQPITLSVENAPLVDFTDLNLPVRGDALGGRIINGERSLWAGDFNEDGKVIYQGPYNDVFFLFSRVLGDGGNSGFLANYIVQDYDLHDFNLDGKVIYQGPNNDRASLLYHTVMIHGGNNGFLANYIVEDALP